MNRSLFLIVIFLIAFALPLRGQDEDKNLMRSIEMEQARINQSGKRALNNYEHWMYSEKEHAIVFYYGSMLQAGFNKDHRTYQFHHDAGLNYRWFMVDNAVVKINLQTWLEFSQLVAGRNTGAFSEELGIISPHNGSDTKDNSLVLEGFYLESLWFNERLDISVGRFDPVFFSTYTAFAGWDKYTYFSKTAASNPVPTSGSGMGVFFEFIASNDFSFGGMITDENPANDYLYIPKFGSTNFNYYGFINFALPFNRDLYSNHNLAYFYVEPDTENPSGKGVIYTGNQGITKDLIMIIKISYGSGLINKLNSAYALGLTYLQPGGNQLGIVGLVNEKSTEYEYGMDVYYKFIIKRWLSISPNLQVYYGINDRLNYIPGLRAFIAY